MYFVKSQQCLLNVYEAICFGSLAVELRQALECWVCNFSVWSIWFELFHSGHFGLTISVWAVLVMGHFGLGTFQSQHFCT